VVSVKHPLVPFDVADFRPMPLVRGPEAFDHRDWLCEVKHDGFRCIGGVRRHTCTLTSRNATVHQFNLLAEEIAPACARTMLSSMARSCAWMQTAVRTSRAARESEHDESVLERHRPRHARGAEARRDRTVWAPENDWRCVR